MIINNFKNILENYIDTHGKLTQREFCRRTGMTRTSASKLWSGRTKALSYKNLNRLVQFFNVPINRILEYKKIPYKFYLHNANGKHESQILLGKSKIIKRPSIIMDCEPLGERMIFVPVSKHYINFHHRGRDRVEYVNIRYTNLIWHKHNKKPLKHGIPNAFNMNKLVNGFSYRLKQYLVSRCITHSGMLQKSDKFSKYIFNIKSSDLNKDIAFVPIKWNNVSIEATPKALIQIQHREPNAQNIFHFTAYVNNEPVLISDRTTNNFVKD